VFVADESPRREGVSIKLVVILGSTVAAIIALLQVMLVNLWKSNDRLVEAVVDQMKTQHTDNLASQRETREVLKELSEKQQTLSETFRRAYNLPAVGRPRRSPPAKEGTP
jgi:hypothetical protein